MELNADDNVDYSTSLHYSEQNVLPNSQCVHHYKFMTDKKMCVSTYSGESPCRGDSGGPLLRKAGIDGSLRLIGVASGGHPSGCESGYPIIYTRLSSYFNWIKRNSGNFYG